MPRVCLSILAHNNRPSLEELVSNLATFVPDARIILFNGGRDATLGDGLPVECCPYSMPVSRYRMSLYHYGVMRWLHERRLDYDFLVTLDSDMYLLKPGLGDFLASTMANAGYMAAHFQPMPTTPAAWTVGRRFMGQWERRWQPLLGTAHPYGCFNPGQTFRREYVERLMRFPAREALLAAMRRTRLDAIEEVIYPTLAVALDCAPIANPGSKALRPRYHSPAELRAHLADPDVFFLHKVGMDPQAPDRRLIRQLQAGDPSRFDDGEDHFAGSYRDPDEGPYARLRARPWLARAFARLKDRYLALGPA